MSWLDILLDRGNEARQLVETPATPTAKPINRQSRPEIKSLWVQTRMPRDDSDPGGCEPAFYSVGPDGVLRMHDEDGKPTGQVHRLAAGEDERRVAARLKREAWSKATPEFHRPLNYSESGWR